MGKQEYLKLANVPVFDVGMGDMEALSLHKPDIIIIDGGFSRWISSDVLGSLAPMHSLSHPGEDWRSTLETVADLLDCKSKVVNIIGTMNRDPIRRVNCLNRCYIGKV
ncbi:hypothetical protein RE628_12825 [Paenibacillus sp. D2_2]|uniref:hypothetical protein n=1 Tax=Paenibacillus sp. D2_2 TaxID=3073092 RepID=UPI002816742F|nr:hypothetical protein [Paenibacillus sp. D2_2]WMT43070.1 hypothetical protein RE628_12825 [Paenibacillus sp. D2_2]